MNYAYDVFLNYNKNLYDFFEWDSCDTIIHVKKMPFFRIKDNDLLNFINKKVKINVNFLNRIYKKTELFNRNINIGYSCIVSNQKMILAIKINKLGEIIEYSKFLSEEEDDLLEYSLSMPISEIEYLIIGENNKNKFETRNELKIRKYIYNELTKMNSENIEKIKYLYLECFNRKINSSLVIKKFIEELENNWDSIYMKVYNFLKMTTTKR